MNEGDGAFYGPKIDLHMTDALGRSWQMGTIQLDAQMPQRFGLSYMGADNAEHTPYVIHRALLGSLERFIGILTEHFGGAFPFWLAPVQVRVVPVGEAHREAAGALAQRLAPYRVEVDESDETVGKQIRNAEVEKIPFVGRLRRQGVRRRARGPRARRRPVDQVACGVSGVPCYADALASRGETVSHLPSSVFEGSNTVEGTVSEVQPSRLRLVFCRCMSAAFPFPKEDDESLVKRI